MDDTNGGQGNNAGGGSYQGYATPGPDNIIESGSEVVHSPTRTADERVDAPKPVIQSLGETPGDANPALAETLGAQSGQTSTAEMLMARESAEEAGVRVADTGPDNPKYQDQVRGVGSQEYMDQDSGRPNWPDDRQREPMDYADSPRAEYPLGTGGREVFGLNMKGRVDAAVDRSSTQASAQESRSGLAPVGFQREEDEYERREMGRPTPPSDMDLIAPEMSNLPPGDDDNGR